MITIRVTNSSDGNEFFDVEGTDIESALENALGELGYDWNEVEREVEICDDCGAAEPHNCPYNC